MSEDQRITHELSFGDVISKTFQLYRREFAKYALLFLVVEAIIGVLTTVVRSHITLPVLPSNASTQQIFTWAPGFFGSLFELAALSALVTWVFYPIAYGTAVKIASDSIEKGTTDLGASIRLVVSKLLWIWVIGIVVGLIVFLGFIALIIPGIILAIMFSLVLPIIIIEKSGFQSLGRSRHLVSNRWLKTLALFVVFGIIIAISSAIAGAISSPFGLERTIVSNILSAFYLPLIPIVLTVYYHSNVARNSTTITGPPPTPPQSTQAGMKFCSYCGTQMPSTAMFCPSCGARQT